MLAIGIAIALGDNFPVHQTCTDASNTYRVPDQFLLKYTTFLKNRSRVVRQKQPDTLTHKWIERLIPSRAMELFKSIYLVQLNQLASKVTFSSHPKPWRYSRAIRHLRIIRADLHRLLIAAVVVIIVIIIVAVPNGDTIAPLLIHSFLFSCLSRSLFHSILACAAQTQ